MYNLFGNICNTTTSRTSSYANRSAGSVSTSSCGSTSTFGTQTNQYNSHYSSGSTSTSLFGCNQNSITNLVQQTLQNWGGTSSWSGTQSTGTYSALGGLGGWTGGQTSGNYTSFGGTTNWGGTQGTSSSSTFSGLGSWAGSQINNGFSSLLDGLSSWGTTQTGISGNQSAGSSTSTGGWYGTGERSTSTGGAYTNSNVDWSGFSGNQFSITTGPDTGDDNVVQYRNANGEWARLVPGMTVSGLNPDNIRLFNATQGTYVMGNSVGAEVSRNSDGSLTIAFEDRQGAQAENDRDYNDVFVRIGVYSTGTTGGQFLAEGEAVVPGYTTGERTVAEGEVFVQGNSIPSHTVVVDNTGSTILAEGGSVTTGVIAGNSNPVFIK